MNLEELKKKLKELKNKYVGMSEPKEYTKEWWQKKADRIIYRDYYKLYQEMTGGQQSLVMTSEEKIARDIGLI